MPPQYGLYAAIAAASVGVIAYDRIKHQLESQVKLKHIHKSIDLACQKHIYGIQHSLDNSVSELTEHCSKNHIAAVAALRGDNKEVLSDLQDFLIHHLTAPDQRVVQLRDEIRRQAAQSHDEASHACDLAMQRVTLLEERLVSMQHELDDRFASDDDALAKNLSALSLDGDTIKRSKFQ